MQTSKVPNWEEDDSKRVIDAEVIEKEDESLSLYKPRLTKKARKELCENKNILPVLATVATRGGGKEELKATIKKASNLHITDCLKEEMEMPCFYMTDRDGNQISNSRAIAKVLMNKAINGDLSSIREILNRTEGKVPNVTQNASISAKVTGEVSALSALMKQIDANKD